MSLESVKLDHDKYEWVLADNYTSEIYRHGELWKNTTGDNFILAAMQEILDLREELNKAIDIIEESGVDYDELIQLQEEK